MMAHLEGGKSSVRTSPRLRAGKIGAVAGRHRRRHFVELRRKPRL